MCGGADESLAFGVGHADRAESVGPLFVVCDADACGVEHAGIQAGTGVDFFFQLNPFFHGLQIN